MKYYNKILKWKFLARLISASQKIVLPGFDGIPLYDVAVFFIKGLFEGNISTRASAIAYNFFLALFPMILVFFGLLPFIPIPDFQETLFELIREMIPKSIFSIVESTIFDILKRPRGGLLSFTFIMALYFSTNGFGSIIEAFNSTFHTMETRTWIKQKLISLLLFFITTIILLIAIVIVTLGNYIMVFLQDQHIIDCKVVIYMVDIGRWIIIVGIMFFSISFIYFLGPAKKSKFQFISAGSTLATFLSLGAALGFNVYVMNFSSYNALYGSIGTLLIILLWLFFNSIILLIGFELNASIKSAGTKSKNGHIHLELS